ncbi:Kif21a protein [Wuchereria bancrofti]|uniref:Kif21a protein n=1 Tax=Wuchereria bancrofti TaxID=6293 RepID=J9DNM0_WUCBA|nr:Kif21a protein [Wuchereria bancrofti]
MGTAFDMMDVMNEIDVGIVPRAIRHLFSGMDSRKQQALEQGFVEPCFDIVAQFVELYNEDIIDLLSHERSPTGLRIHEDAKGEIFLNGVTRVTVTSPSQTLEVLKNGALNRKTASTNMNEQSSRSHAIFTVIIKQQRTVVVKPCFDPQTVVEQGDETSASEDPPATELELLSAKFHFVDLAGSERLKRTGATGDRIKEGININFGLVLTCPLLFFNMQN